MGIENMELSYIQVATFEKRDKIKEIKRGRSRQISSY